MSVRDHEPISFDGFLGTYDRGEDEAVPPGYFKDSKNIKFVNQSIGTRDGSRISISLPSGSIRRVAIYKRLGEAPRLLILNDSGQLYDSLTGTIILNIAAMTDFSMVSMFNRAYITPHNGLKGLPGQSLQVYEGSGIARPAGGTGPLAFPGPVVTEGSSANFDSGLHFFAVAFETSSGFISPFGAYAMGAMTGGKSAILSGIPGGPIGTVARVLMGTKQVPDGTVDFANQTWYFIPNGRIPDNTTATKEVAYYDADLQAESSYLLDQMGQIPAGVGLNIYRGRLILWGEDLNESILRASAVGQPESFDAADGFATVNPGDSGGGIKYCFEYRSQLICCKTQRSYITMDNGNPAAYWEVNALDKSVGTECHGVGKILDFGEDVRDRAFIADRSGLQLFTGTFSDAEITYNIADIWDRINKAHFHKVEVAVDPLKALVYCAVPLDGATENTHVIVGDWQNGLSVKDVRFTVWQYPYRPQSIVVDIKEADKESLLKFAGLDSPSVFEELEGARLDNNLAIDTVVEFPLLPQGDDYPINHFAGFRTRIKGNGILQITLASLGAIQTAFVPSLIITPTPGRPYFRGFNFTSERCAVKLRMNQASEYFLMSHFSLYHKVLWLTRAE